MKQPSGPDELLARLTQEHRARVDAAIAALWKECMEVALDAAGSTKAYKVMPLHAIVMAQVFRSLLMNLQEKNEPGFLVVVTQFFQPEAVSALSDQLDRAAKAHGVDLWRDMEK